MSLKNIVESNIIVCGIVRDCEKTIFKELKTINQSINKFKNKYFFIVESDSKDNTIKALDECKKKFKNFKYLTLGKLENQIKSRTNRLAYCRNKYLDFINCFKYKIDFVLIADLDGVNNLLTEDAIESCWSSSERWDVVTANQSYEYFDIYALRHKFLNSFNHLEAIKEMKQNFESKDLFKFFIKNKYFRISKKSNFIEVDSAFGGLAIYKKKTLEKVKYFGEMNNFELCEHVPLNLQITDNNYKIFINPKLINTDYTIHTPKINLFRKLFGYNLKSKFKKVFI